VVSVKPARLEAVTDRARGSILLDLYAANNKSGLLVDRAVEGSGLTSEDFAFVSMINMREPVTPTELAREFGHSLSTVLFRAGRNVELGFVERVTNPQDGRSFLLRLTPAGRDAWRRAGSNLGRILESLETRLARPSEEIRQVLLELQQALEAELASGTAPARG
jgi:DNA-binding MarR family transcriptional regulator